jgi:hypothetical protein
MSIKDQEDGQKEEDGPTDSTSDEARKQQRRNNRSPPAWEAARCSRAACRAACRAAGSTLAASAAFISSTSTAFVCSVSIVIAQFAVRHCELGTGGSHAAPLVAVHVGRAEAFELAEAVTAGLEAAVRRYTTSPPHQPPAPPPSPSGKNDLETHIIVDFPLAPDTCSASAHLRTLLVRQSSRAAIPDSLPGPVWLSATGHRACPRVRRRAQPAHPLSTTAGWAVPAPLAYTHLYHSTSLRYPGAACGVAPLVDRERRVGCSMDSSCELLSPL